MFPFYCAYIRESQSKVAWQFMNFVMATNNDKILNGEALFVKKIDNDVDLEE